MKHRIAVPDGLMIPDSATPTYPTGVAEADTFQHAYLIGRTFAQTYGKAYLLTEDGHHLFTAWRKATEEEDHGGIRPVITGRTIDRHPAGASVWTCPACALVEESITEPTW